MNDAEREMLEEARLQVIGGFVYTRPVKRAISPISIENLYPRMIMCPEGLIDIPNDPLSLKSIESIFGKIVAKE